MIQILRSETINSIAAGEVVERPASAAKELVENALDAGADQITVEIRGGGKSLLRVTDNGCGIPENEIRLAFCRHATSKLRDISDLQTISSLGFRGEALSSIAAVSKCEMISKPKDQLFAVRICISGGTEESFEEIGAPNGTTVIMRDLFYNTPAREKFLRSSVTEANAVTAFVEQLALSHPTVSFRLISDGAQKVYTSGSGDLLECAFRIYGKAVTDELIRVESKKEYIEAEGYIGLPLIARGNRNFENYFVNGRYIKDKILSSAIEEGYHGHLMQHRYPFTLLNIRMDPAAVDVNVHPAKAEVRFSNQSDIYEELREIVSDALMRREEIPDAAIAETPVPVRPAPEAPEAPGMNAAVQPAGSATEITKAADALPLSGLSVSGRGSEPVRPRKMPEIFENRRMASQPVPKAPETPELIREKQLSIFDDAKAEKRIDFRMIGQVFGTYVLIEYNDDFYIIDQHAAHEKVLFEKFMKDVRERSVATQYLMPAKLLTLTAAENDLFRENLSVFEELGYEIEHFEGREWRITGMPADLFVRDTDEFFKDLLDALNEEGRRTEALQERIASRACKAAVKGNSYLSDSEIRALISDLLNLEDPYHCPHGRPTMIKMTHYELDKKFKRIV